MRQQNINNFDFSVYKDTKVGPGEKIDIQFRGEFFNIFNKPQFGPPGTSLGTSQFGVVSTQVNNQRLVQFGLRFSR